jgi:hypothetical protein
VPSVRVTVEREEVIPGEQDVGAEVLGFSHGTADGRVVGVLRLDL